MKTFLETILRAFLLFIAAGLFYALFSFATGYLASFVIGGYISSGINPAEAGVVTAYETQKSLQVPILAATIAATFCMRMAMSRARRYRP